MGGKGWRSTTATGRPAAARVAARVAPTGPAPRMQAATSRVSVMGLSCHRAAAGSIRPQRGPVLHKKQAKRVGAAASPAATRRSGPGTVLGDVMPDSDRGSDRHEAGDGADK